MLWSELDLEAGVWHLPGERTKNGQAHTVPLSRQAVELIEAVERRPGRENLFGNGNGAYSGWEPFQAAAGRAHCSPAGGAAAWARAGGQGEAGGR
jgi:integrase